MLQWCTPQVFLEISWSSCRWPRFAWSHAWTHCNLACCSPPGSFCLAKCFCPNIQLRCKGWQPCPDQRTGPSSWDDGSSRWRHELFRVPWLRSPGWSSGCIGWCIPCAGPKKSVWLHFWHGRGGNEARCGCQVQRSLGWAWQQFWWPTLGP